jgi:cation diffusion facilitator CzcD-associated flavoprotein CzcO
VAIVPDGDFFHSIKLGTASVVTDQIERFTPTGIRLQSGDELAADVVVTATGFSLNVLGDIDFTVDDRPIDFAETVSWRGAMFTEVPNLVWVFGYFRSSWTLRVDMLADFVCRLFDHMDSRGARTVTPMLRPDDSEMPLKPWVEPDDFNPGYITRGLHKMPKQGSYDPWCHTQDYGADKDDVPAADLDDGSLIYG